MTIGISNRIRALPDEDLIDIVEATKKIGSYRKLELATGMPVGEIQRRHKEAARRGLLGFTPPVLPGFEVTQITNTPKGDFIQTKPAPETEFEIPPGHVIKGISSLVDNQGREKLKWVKTKIGVMSLEDLVESLKTAFDGYPHIAAPIPASGELCNVNLLNFIPCNDWHINMMCWAREVGQNWDIKIAETAIGNAIYEVIRRAKCARKAIVLGGGDLMHNDDNTNRTAKSSAVLDCDGRFQKGLEATQRLKVLTIDTALKFNDEIEVRILPGNHDEYASIAIGHFLRAWYRNEPRVKVDLSADLYWWFRWGKVFLGATHGHTVNPIKLPGIMAARRAEDWGASKFRYLHTFHIHHKDMRGWEDNGVIGESHQAPIPKDAWHHGSGYLSERSLQVITYHANYGETGRVREAILGL